MSFERAKSPAIAALLHRMLHAKGHRAASGGVARRSAPAVLVLALAHLCQSCKFYTPEAAGSVDSTAASWPTSDSSVQSPDTAVMPRSCVPGQQTQCSENELGQPLLFPFRRPRGRCQYGKQDCQADGRWGPCVGAVGPLPQDNCSVQGDDSNCNGAANDGCACVEQADQVRECGKSVGACEKGTQRCIDGRWGACEGEKVAAAERCDGQGIDEDCDGSADEEDADCECVDGAVVRCFVPEAKGDCALGQKRCEGGKMGRCLALRAVKPERCGRAEPDRFGRATGDEDCDGLVDEAQGPEPALGCKIYHLDQDGDSWGAMGPSYIENPQKATHGCFCKSPPPALSTFVLAQADRENRDCGDCEEGGNLVKPTQDHFLSDASSCLKTLNWRGGVYDYDCNGKEELRFDALHQGQCEATGVKEGDCRWAEGASGYWVGQVEACGVKGFARRCFAKEVAGVMSCVASESDSEHKDWTQRCR